MLEQPVPMPPPPVADAKPSAFIDAGLLRAFAVMQQIVGGVLAIIGSLFLYRLLESMPHFSTTSSLFGAMYTIMMTIMMCITGFVWLLAILAFLSGCFLWRRKFRVFCLIVAAIECLFIPFGTAFGVVTIAFLLRPTARALFAPAPSMLFQFRR